jgi:hypothetical protein
MCISIEKKFCFRSFQLDDKKKQRDKEAGDLAEGNVLSFHVDNVTKGWKGRFGIPELRDKIKAGNRVKCLVPFSHVGYRRVKKSDISSYHAVLETLEVVIMHRPIQMNRLQSEMK